MSFTSFYYIGGDTIDGKVARKHKTGSSLGAFFDQSSDGFGIIICWVHIPAFCWAMPGLTGIWQHILVMWVLYMPFWSHMITNHHRWTVGNFGMTEAFCCYSLLALLVLGFGSDMFHYDLLLLLPAQYNTFGLQFPIYYIFICQGIYMYAIYIYIYIVCYSIRTYHVVMCLL